MTTTKTVELTPEEVELVREEILEERGHLDRALVDSNQYAAEPDFRDSRENVVRRLRTAEDILKKLGPAPERDVQ